MTLDPRSLIQFVAVAEEMSFSRAATRLGIAQPWLSRRIGQLEQQLGFTLFARTTRRVELTDNGQALLETARPLALAMRATEQAAQTLARADRQVLRIGMPPYGPRLPIRNRILQQFARAHPRVALELEVGWTPLLIERVRRGDLDGAFGIGWEDGAGLTRLPICTLEVQLLIGASDPLAAVGAAALEALKDRRIAVFMRGLYPTLHDWAYGPLADAGARLIQVPEIHDRLIASDDDAFSPLMVAEFTQAVGRTKPNRLRLAGAPDAPFCLFTAARPGSAALEGLKQISGALAALP